MNTYFEGVDLGKILEVIAAFNGERNSIRLLDVIITKMRDITDCEAGTLYVVKDGGLHFTILHNEKLGVFSYGDEIKLPPVSLDKDNIENVSAYCAIEKTMVNIGDIYEDARFNFQGPKKYDAMTGFRTRSMLVFPLSDMHENVIGVIQLINARDPSGGVTPFDKRLEFMLKSLANIAATALANVRYMEEIKELFYSFVRIMSAAVDERTPYNASHTRQMAEYTRSFVRYLRERFPEGSPYHMDENREEQLIMATLLHDIGKIVTPLGVMNKQSRLGGRLPLLKQRFTVKKLQAKIAFLSGEVSEDAYASEAAALDGDWEFIERINTAELISDGDRERVKSVTARTYTGENGVPAPLFEPYDIECLSVAKGTLTDAEREIMREHVEITGRFLDNIKFNKQYENVPGWAKSHHELLDGTGYPDRLPGSRIPTEVRILTVMDVYDSLTASDRPYKKALTHETALRILRSMAEEGKLDAEIVSLFSESGIRVL